MAHMGASVAYQFLIIHLSLQLALLAPDSELLKFLPDLLTSTGIPAPGVLLSHAPLLLLLSLLLPHKLLLDVGIPEWVVPSREPVRLGELLSLAPLRPAALLAPLALLPLLPLLLFLLLLLLPLLPLLLVLLLLCLLLGFPIKKKKKNRGEMSPVSI